MPIGAIVPQMTFSKFRDHRKIPYSDDTDNLMCHTVEIRDVDSAYLILSSLTVLDFRIQHGPSFAHGIQCLNEIPQVNGYGKPALRNSDGPNAH
jgi:hypothetical protein